MEEVSKQTVERACLVAICQLAHDGVSPIRNPQIVIESGLTLMQVRNARARLDRKGYFQSAPSSEVMIKGV